MEHRAGVKMAVVSYLITVMTGMAQCTVLGIINWKVKYWIIIRSS